MLKFIKAAPYFPDLSPATPFVTPEDRERAAQEPPEAVPYHCKPWIDGQSLGYTVRYGYLTPVTIVGLGNDEVRFDNADATARERPNNKPVVEMFARGHFGFASGYILKTPPGYVSLVLPPNNPPPNLHMLTAVIETDWYPKPVFLVFATPPRDVSITLDYQTELARVVVIPRPKREKAQPLTEADLAEYDAANAAYKAESQSLEGWRDVHGYKFTHLYKVWSQRNRRGEPLFES